MGKTSQSSTPELDLTHLGVDLNPEMQALLSLTDNHLPMQQYNVYSGYNTGLASSLIGNIANQSRRFEILNPTKDFRIEIYRARLAKSQIGLTYNSHAMRIVTPKPTKHYTLVIPLAGSCNVASPQGSFEFSASTAFFHSANSSVNTGRSDKYLAIVLLLSLSGFETFIGDEFDVAVTPEQAYALRLDLTDPVFQPFCSLLGTLIKVLDAPTAQQSHQDLIISRVEEAMWYQFFVSCPEIYKAHRRSQEVHTAPAPVRRVVDYIKKHAHEELSMKELVDVSAASLRSLHAGFKDNYGCGPMAFVRKTRLEHCRQQLLAAAPAEVSVTDVAAEWGFFHLSNFARYYHNEFGELPSETLKVVKIEELPGNPDT